MAELAQWCHRHAVIAVSDPIATGSICLHAYLKGVADWLLFSFHISSWTSAT